MTTETLKQLECLRCGHKWWPQSPKKPKYCASCNSPYYETKRGTLKAGRPKRTK